MTASYPVFKRRLYRICRTAMSPASDISSSPLGDLIIVQADLLSDCTDPHSLSSQLYDSRSLRQALRRLWGAYQLPKLLFFSRTQHKFSTLLGHRKHPSIFSSKCHYYLRDTTLGKSTPNSESQTLRLRTAPPERNRDLLFAPVAHRLAPGFLLESVLRCGERV